MKIAGARSASDQTSFVARVVSGRTALRLKAMIAKSAATFTVAHKKAAASVGRTESGRNRTAENGGYV